MSHFKVKGVNEVKKGRDQWGMQGRAQGQAQALAPPTLFLDQTEAKRNEKILRLGPHLISGSGWQAPPPHPPYLKVWVCHWGLTLGDVLPRYQLRESCKNDCKN